MSQITDFTENLYVDHEFRGASYTKPTVQAVALFIAAPSDTGGGTEVSGGSYARVALNPSNTNWTSTQGGTSGASTGTSGITTNAIAVTFPAPSANWGTVVAVGIFDATTSGNLKSWEFLTTANSKFLFTAVASTDTFFAPGHNFANGEQVACRPKANSALPTGITANSLYYVISVSGASFALATTAGGTAINITTDGAGEVIKVVPQNIVSGAAAPSFAVGSLGYKV